MTETIERPTSLLSAVVASRTRGLLASQMRAQGELADYLGISQPAVSFKLKARTPFTLNEVPMVADFFGVSQAYVLGMTNDPLEEFAVRHVGLEPTTRWLGGRRRHLSLVSEQLVDVDQAELAAAAA